MTHAGSRARHERVLTMWAAGSTAAEIGDAVGTTANNVRAILHTARKAGDPRAVLRHGGRPPAGYLAEAIAARAEGVPYKVLARRFGASPEAIGMAVCRALRAQNSGSGSHVVHAPTMEDLT